MKKTIVLLIASAMCVAGYAQDAKTKDSDIQKKKISPAKVKEETSKTTLDGRSFNISFTEKKGEAKTVEALPADKASEKPNIQTDKSDYSMFDKNSKVILTFISGNLLSPVFDGNGCPYRINTSGNDMYAFSARCKLSSGKNKNTSASDIKPTEPMTDSKLAMDAQNKTVADPDHTDVSKMPDKNTVPPPVNMEEEKNTVNPSSGNVAPPAAALSGDWQKQSAPVMQTGYMATISGVVSGNSIEGTLNWTDAGGKAMSYSFTGSAATKKDMNENHDIGMK